MNDLQKFYQNKKVLVTGHTGFKGSWLCSWLNFMGANVSGFSLAPDDNQSHFEMLSLGNKMGSVIGDVRDYDYFKEIIVEVQPDIIFHLAAQPLVRDSYHDPINTFNINVMGTANLLDIVNRENMPVTVVNVTTDKCYENIETATPYIETMPLGGHDPYSASKACAEIVNTSFRKSFFSSPKSNVKLASARAGNIIGGGDFCKDRIIPDILRSILSDEKVELRSPDAVRPWQHVLDALYGYLLLAKAIFEDETGNRKFETAYNFAPLEKEFITVKQIVEQFVSIIGRGGYSLKIDNTNPHEAKLLLLDSTKAEKELGWKNKFDVRQSVEQTAIWYKQFLDDRENISDFTIKQIENYVALI